MITIVDILREIAEAITTSSMAFFDAEKYEANEKADKLAAKFILMVHPIKGRDEILPGGNQKETYNVVLMFCHRSKLEQKQEQREAHIAEMIAVKKEYVTRLDNHSQVEKILNSDHETFTNEFDRNMDGVLWFGSVKLWPVENVCPPA